MSLFQIFQPILKWLQNNQPTGGVEKYPILDDNFETNQKGIFVIGDLTGIPLLKLAVESGRKVWSSINGSNQPDILDAVIIGGGPAGISAGIEGFQLKKKFIILEASEVFQTIHSYPKGKPIISTPESVPIFEALPIRNGTKESLLEDLNDSIKKLNLPLHTGEAVVSINKKDNYYIVNTNKNSTFKAKNIIIAMGKSGNPKKLNIPGESLSKVFYRFIDPKDFIDEDLIIVGGGDSAIEAAISCSKYAKTVTLSYRGKQLSKPKEENKISFLDLVKNQKIHFFPESNPMEILSDSVILKTQEKVLKKIKNTSVLILIGSEPPIPFLKQLGIMIQNEINFRQYIAMISFLGFSTLAYFGKASFYGADWMNLPAIFGLVISIFSFIVWIIYLQKENDWIIPNPWNLFRNIYLFSAFFYFTFTYLSSKYFNFNLFDKYPSFHYSLLYSLTIFIFGIRRIYTKPSKYIKLQTSSLIFFQVVTLFLLPEIILPYLGSNSLLGAEDGFLLTQVFPNHSYWKAYGFVLAWPLNMGVLYDGGITTFWLFYGIFLSFGVIPLLVYRYGKGAYCGWICSCGGLAETLGDEHRTKMPHTRFVYKIEHSGQIVLFIAFLLTSLKLLGLGLISDQVKWIYDLVVDIGLAGVVGVGLYFIYSGRIWCRIFCPLAALMHIYAKFSQFRIFSEKKNCISCNICTKVCHQGIDVMSYANVGRPMDSVQCVRCSACVSSCPTDVLSFGRLVDSQIKLDSLSGKAQKS